MKTIYRHVRPAAKSFAKKLTALVSGLTTRAGGVAAIILLCGCNTTSLTVTKPDGVVVSVRNTRILWATDSYAASWSTNGASLSANKSNVDREALGVVVSAAVSAAAKSVVP